MRRAYYLVVTVGRGGPGAALGGEAPECGVCGSSRCRFAGAIDGRRFAVCLDCDVERVCERVAEPRLEVLYGNYYRPIDPSPAEMEQQLANPSFELRRLRIERALA